jgi:hypothetical protein
MFTIECHNHVRHDDEEELDFLRRMVNKLVSSNASLINLLTASERDRLQLYHAIVVVTSKLNGASK